MCKTFSIIRLLFVLSIFSTNIVLAQTFTLKSGEVLSDPTKPERWRASVGTQSTSQTTFTLNSIVVSAGQKRATINGKKVLEGQFISGAKVKRIKPTSVHLLHQGSLKKLQMNKVSGIKRN